MHREAHGLLGIDLEEGSKLCKVVVLLGLPDDLRGCERWMRGWDGLWWRCGLTAEQWIVCVVVDGLHVDRQLTQGVDDLRG